MHPMETTINSLATQANEAELQKAVLKNTISLQKLQDYLASPFASKKGLDQANRLIRRIQKINLSTRGETAVVRNEMNNIQSNLSYTFKNPNNISTKDLSTFIFENKKNITQTHPQIRTYLENNKIIVTQTGQDFIDANKFGGNEVLAQKLANWINNLHKKFYISNADVAVGFVSGNIAGRFTETQTPVKINQQEVKKVQTVITKLDEIAKKNLENLNKESTQDLIKKLNKKDSNVFTQDIYTILAKRLGNNGITIQNNKVVFTRQEFKNINTVQATDLAAVWVSSLLNTKETPQEIQRKIAKKTTHSPKETVFLHLYSTQPKAIVQQNNALQTQYAVAELTKNPNNPKAQVAMNQAANQPQNKNLLKYMMDPNIPLKNKFERAASSPIAWLFIIIGIWSKYGLKGILIGGATLIAGSMEGLTLKSIAGMLGEGIDQGIDAGKTWADSPSTKQSLKTSADNVSEVLKKAGKVFDPDKWTIFHNDAFNYNESLKENKDLKKYYIESDKFGVLSPIVSSILHDKKKVDLTNTTTESVISQLTDSQKTQLKAVYGEKLEGLNKDIKSYITKHMVNIFEKSGKDSADSFWTKLTATVSGATSSAVNDIKKATQETFGDYSKNPEVEKSIKTQLSNLINTGENEEVHTAAKKLKQAILTKDISTFTLEKYNFSDNIKSKFTAIIDAFKKDYKAFKLAKETKNKIKQIKISLASGEIITQEIIDDRIQNLEKIYGDYNNATLEKDFYKKSVASKYNSKLLELYKLGADNGINKYTSKIKDLEEKKAQTIKEENERKQKQNLEKALKEMPKIPSSTSTPKEFAEFLETKVISPDGEGKISIGELFEKDYMNKVKSTFIKNYKERKKIFTNKIVGFKVLIDSVGTKINSKNNIQQIDINIDNITSLKKQIYSLKDQIQELLGENTKGGIQELKNFFTQIFNSPKNGEYFQTIDSKLGLTTANLYSAEINNALIKKLIELETNFSTPSIKIEKNEIHNPTLILKQVSKLIKAYEIVDNFVFAKKTQEKSSIKEQLNKITTNYKIALENTKDKTGLLTIYTQYNSIKKHIQNTIDTFDTDNKLKQVYEKKYKEILLSNIESLPVSELFSIDKKGGIQIILNQDIKLLQKIKDKANTDSIFKQQLIKYISNSNTFSRLKAYYNIFN